MKVLTAEISNLLDKLYNLRGEDSSILSNMEKEKAKAEATKGRTTEEKSILQRRIEKMTEEERILKEEGEKLVDTLSRIKTNDFKTVLEKLNVNFNPDRISEEVNRMLPKTIQRVKEEVESARNDLLRVEAEMNTAVATLEELIIRKDEALANQARLNEYFELALKGNINITRDSITNLLEKFNFNEEERRETAKILMFPEDALFQYDEELKNGTKKVEEPIFFNTTPEVNINYKETIRKSPREELEDLLEDLSFNYSDFSTSDLERILSNYNEELLRDNVNFVKSKNLGLDLFIENIEFLYDKELKNKMSKLIEIGKEAYDVYLNPSVLKKYSMDGLNSAINKIINNGFDPKKVPLIAY